MHHSRPRTTGAKRLQRKVLSRHPFLSPPGVEYGFNPEVQTDLSTLAFVFYGGRITIGG
jgi:hypothetical protein